MDVKECALLLMLLCLVNASRDEVRLRDQLMRTYPGQLVRPVEHNEDNVTVSHGLSLQHFEFDSTTKLFTGLFWINMGWTDPAFRWSSRDYGGLRSLRMRQNDIWIPDILIYNGHNTGDLQMTDTLVVVYSDGQMNWVPPIHFTVKCSEANNDEHGSEWECSLKFGSWTHDGNNIDLQAHSDTVDMSTARIHEKWEVTFTESQRNVFQYSCCPEPYIDVTYKIGLKNK